MGKQINFYMAAGDERDFLDFVRADRNPGIFRSVQASSEITLLNDELPNQETPGWFSLCMWDRDHSPPPRLKYIDTQKHFTVDRAESEVIEFLRSTVDAGRLVRGRLWAQLQRWDLTEDPPKVVRKSESFAKWFEQLANWVKRHAVRDNAGDYILPGAAQFEKQGGKLVQAVLSDSVRHFRHEV